MADVELTEAERLLVRAKRRARRLAVALVQAPFAAATVAELRDFLDEDAERARDSFAQLRSRSAREITARIEELGVEGRS